MYIIILFMYYYYFVIIIIIINTLYLFVYPASHLFINNLIFIFYFNISFITSHLLLIIIFVLFEIKLGVRMSYVPPKTFYPTENY